MTARDTVQRGQFILRLIKNDICHTVHVLEEHAHGKSGVGEIHEDKMLS
jgi:hypothetical protein